LEENSGMSEGAGINMLNANFSMANTMGRTSNSPKMQAEFRTWSEALQISQAFSGKFEAAQKLTMQMNAAQRIIPPDFEVGSTEPQPSRNPAVEHAKLLNSAAWILATDESRESLDFNIRCVSLDD
jgi:hypothetical protein